MELILIARPDGALQPYDEVSIEAARKIKPGRLVRGKFTQVRNPKFLAKFMALCRLGYDVWSETIPPREYKGQPVMAVFDNFREDMVILAGYFTARYDIAGGVHLKAKSISFANMDEATFERVFSNVLQVILTRVLGKIGMTEESIRAHVDRVMEFDR